MDNLRLQFSLRSLLIAVAVAAVVAAGVYYVSRPTEIKETNQLLVGKAWLSDDARGRCYVYDVRFVSGDREYYIDWMPFGSVDEVTLKYGPQSLSFESKDHPFKKHEPPLPPPPARVLAAFARLQGLAAEKLEHLRWSASLSNGGSGARNADSREAIELPDDFPHAIIVPRGQDGNH